MRRSRGKAQASLFGALGKARNGCSCSLQAYPLAHRVFQEAMITWLADKLWIKDLKQRRLGVPRSDQMSEENESLLMSYTSSRLRKTIVSF